MWSVSSGGTPSPSPLISPFLAPLFRPPSALLLNNSLLLLPQTFLFFFFHPPRRCLTPLLRLIELFIFPLLLFCQELRRPPRLAWLTSSGITVHPRADHSAQRHAPPPHGRPLCLTRPAPTSPRPLSCRSSR